MGNFDDSIDTDVLVIGGGTAGVVAAIASARMGKRTILVEQNGFLGGTATAALVTPMMANHINRLPLNTGICEEINQRLERTGDGALASDGNSGWFNPEKLKFVLEDLVLEAGVECIYYSFVHEVLVDQGRVAGIVLHNKSGKLRINSRLTIDASGDADVAFKAGVPFESGNPFNEGKNQAMSMRFHMGQVDLPRVAAFIRSIGGYCGDYPFMHAASVWGHNLPLEPLLRKAVDDGILEMSDGDYFQFFSVPGRPGELAFNCPRITERVDGTNVFHLTDAAQRGRRIIARFERFLKAYIPGFEESYIVMTSQMVGVRESRRIVGSYTLSQNDVRQGAKFEDAIARSCYPIDVHSPNRGDEQKLDFGNLPEGQYHEIPYRCLVPMVMDSLLVAGRCISADFHAQSAIRIESNCRAFGEAAGTAAALCIDHGLEPRNLSGILLRKILYERGCNLL
ncbi:FAD dependent oxidoreductase [Paenibacillus taihuensis]|uniref:FAD dependent oxidoreductase n=1 Tax=Paenibacillus taihuensis TaxID=1156355 RepID=A0A3D9QUM7_9BACL|nr:FAD-dependent oxidoreductase [Paenibacillus taihuensis]REE67328.1 FAD dependent oxidoreductase [Paenibacillus taihuensis]